MHLHIVLGVIMAVLVSVAVLKNRKRGLGGFLRHEAQSTGRRLAGVWSGVRLVTLLIIAVLVVIVIAVLREMAFTLAGFS